MVCLPEDIARRSRRGMAMGRMLGSIGGEILPSKTLFAEKAKSVSFGGAGGIRTHGPRKANGFRVRLVMTTSILLHDEIISGDG